MIGLGTILNSAGIVAGGLMGHFIGKRFKPEQQDSLNKACGVSVMFIAIAGAMSGMLQIEGNSLSSGRSMLVVLCLAIGTVAGELIGIERGFDRFGEWLKRKTHSTGDTRFVDGFVTASLTVSIGAMAIVGAIADGMTGDWSLLAAKAILDFTIVLVMTCSMGKGCIFSALPVLVFEGLITLLAVWVKPLMTETALANLSMVGSALVFCVGINLVFGKKIRVANLLPAVVFAIAAAFLPI